MYNMDVKLDYIKDYIKRNYAAETLSDLVFRTTQPYEEMYDKDVCDFTMIEITSMYKGFCSASNGRLVMWNNFLQMYTRYCLENNLVYDGQNHYDEITNDVINACLNYGKIDDKIITREQLEKDIPYLLNSSDRAVVLCFYEGLYGKNYSDLTSLTLDHINGNHLNLERGKLKVSESLINAITQSANEYQYYMYTEGDIGEVRDFAENDNRVFKRMFNASAEKETPKNLERRLYHKARRISVAMGSGAYAVNALRESGRIHMINELIKKENMTPADTIKKHHKDIAYRYSRIQSIPRYVDTYSKYFIA